MGRKRGFQRESSDDLFFDSQDLPGPSRAGVSSQRRTRLSTLTESHMSSQDIASTSSQRRTRPSTLMESHMSSQYIASTSSQRRTRTSALTESHMSSQDIASTSSQRRTRPSTLMESHMSSQDIPSTSSQRRTRTSAVTESHMSSQKMEAEKDTQLISSVIRYLFAADRNKQPIQKTHIVKNVLAGNSKMFRSIIDKVNDQLSEVFGYNLIEVENNKYIMVNEIENDVPHLTFRDSHKQVLLYLVLVHIFMYGESCKEEVLWDFFRHLGIINNDNFQHEYFGDVNQLVTVEFVNQRYLERTMIDKYDPTKFEYSWGSRAKNELTYRSALTFVGEIYGCPINKWKLQYKAVDEEDIE
ncbi:non-structural maintenance of chromosomes element 3 homolog [Temnothorax curvispinosus]|uniref:Non-structural maintenance of chromosomes element 3 homolog n=1 Tax=Temnothorax curvispinosus TaxID=300111 RepID=A0A6J1Q8B6_9HYME|nr:non-structural maintenance of chromosomes element 3 homolog [Temnothorax curvispinosus]XP_024878507.1 non-structural maintenance of chromosomes element 3 homolog [Temnothorax curvispinosus]